MKTFKLLLHVLFGMGHFLVAFLFLLSAFSDRISPENTWFSPISDWHSLYSWC
jgi:hypothetical protein